MIMNEIFNRTKTDKLVIKAKSETFFKRVFDYKTFDKTVYI